MVSHISAIFLAAVVASVYGLPTDNTLVSTASVVGGAYPTAPAPAGYDAAANAAAVAPEPDYAAPQDGYKPPPSNVDDYDQAVDSADEHRGRPRGRGRRPRHRRDSVSDCSEGCSRSRSRHSHRDSDTECSEDRSRSRSHSRRPRRDSVSGCSEGCSRSRSRRPRRDSDSDCSDRSRSRSRHSRSRSRDSRSGRSVSRGSRSESCDSSWSGRSSSRGHRSQSCDSRCSRDSGSRRPWGRRPWGLRPYGPRPHGFRPYGPRPYGPRPIRHPYGSDNDSDCDSSDLKGYFDGRAGVDRRGGRPRHYGGEYPEHYGPGHYGDHDGYGVDSYDQDHHGHYSGGEHYGHSGDEHYGHDGDYGHSGDEHHGHGGDYGHDDHHDDYEGDYNGDRDHGYGGRPVLRPRGRLPVSQDRRYSQHDFDANTSQRTVDIKDRRQGRFSLEERHADEQSFDRSGRERVMVDRFGQRVTSRQEEVDAARRSADARNVRIRGPSGSLDHKSRSASEDKFSSDRHERTFNGPNRQASERSFSTSTSSRDVNSESTRIVGRPSFRQ